MRKSHSYSKRELLDSLPAAVFLRVLRRLQEASVRRGTQAAGTKAEGVHRGLSARRRETALVHRTVPQEGPSSRDWAERTCTSGFDLAVRYSRDPDGQRGPARLDLPAADAVGVLLRRPPSRRVGGEGERSAMPRNPPVLGARAGKKAVERNHGWRALRRAARRRSSQIRRVRHRRPDRPRGCATPIASALLIGSWV